LLLDSTPLALSPPAPKSAAGAEVASLPTLARMVAPLVASTCTAPSAVTALPSASARAWARDSPSYAAEISGSPIRASTASKNTLLGSQPIVLNARRKPQTSAPEAIAARVVASISARRSASRVTSPVTSTVLESTTAEAPPSTRLVAITAPTARDVPCPVKELPPPEVAVTSASARMAACCTARTVSEAASITA